MKKVLMPAALLAVMLLAASIAAPGQEAKPDFTGKWVLDVAKSEFGPLPAPESQVNEIDHKEPKIKVATTSRGSQGERKTERNLTTDGEENTNAGFGGSQAKSRSKWDGKRLVTESTTENPNFGKIEIKEVWELAEDGKQLTVARDFKSSQGDANQKMIFKKE